MSVALRAITRLQDADDINVSLGVGEDGKTLVYDHDTARFVLAAAAGGGVTDHGALTGLADDDHTQYLLATGTRAGASSQAQAFTNGIVGPTWKPASDSTTALQLQNAAGTAVLTVDTSNERVGIGATPARLFHLAGDTPYFRMENTAVGGVVMEMFAGTAGLGIGTSTTPSQLCVNSDALTNSIVVESNRVLFSSGVLIAPAGTSLSLRSSTDGAAGYTAQIEGYAASYGWEAAISAPNKATGHIDVIIANNGGDVAIGHASPDSKLHVNLDDAATSTASQLLTLSHNTSGTAAAGYGSRTLWELQSSTTADQAAAALDVAWTNATHATRTAKAALSGVRSGTLYELAAFSGAEGVVLNETGESWADFRVEGDTATHLLFVDASADAVGIGTSAPGSRLHVSQTTGDAGIREVVRVAHNSSGTPGKGFGVSLALALETTTTEGMVAGLVAASWASATHASRSGDLIGYAADASGEREGWRVRASGSAPMLGLFGASPILRPTTSYAAAGFTANSGTAVNDASTFDGYTIKQVVKALRDLGALT